MRKISYIILFLFVSFLSMSLFIAEAKASTGLTVGLDYANKNIWRGTYLYDKEGIFAPFVSYDVLDTGLSLTIGAGLADEYIFDGKKNSTKYFRDQQTTDFGLDYSNKFGMVTFGAGFYYYWYWANELSYSETHVSFTLEDIILSPTVICTWDYYFGDNYEGANVGNRGKDFYIQLGISHSFDLVKDVASLNLGALAGYYKCLSAKTSGISDIDLSAELSITDGPIGYTAGFHYVIVPSKDYYYWPNLHEFKMTKDRSRFYSSFGVSYSF